MMKNSILFILPIALLLDLLIPFVLAQFYSGYKHSLQVMSVLGNSNSPVHIIYNCWLVLLGVFIIIGTHMIYNIVMKQSHVVAILLSIVMVIYAIGGCVLSGLFSVGETKELVTIAAKIHAFGSVIGFMLLTLAPLFCGIYAFMNHQIGLSVFSICCFVLAIVFFVLFVMADKVMFQNTMIAQEGLWQRLTLLFMYLPIAGICLSSVIKVGA